MPEPIKWKCTIKSLFVMDDVVYRPGPIYRVPPSVYNGTVTFPPLVPTATPFKDLCATAEPIFSRV